MRPRTAAYLPMVIGAVAGAAVGAARGRAKAPEKGVVVDDEFMAG